MASILSFLLLVVVPIWGVAMLLTRWLERMGERLSEDVRLADLADSEREFSARLRALEALVAEERRGR